MYCVCVCVSTQNQSAHIFVLYIIPIMCDAKQFSKLNACFGNNQTRMSIIKR